MAERYDKVHRNIIKIDNKLIVDLFNVVGTMNINEIRQFSLIEQIPYTVIDANGNTLIHRVLLENNILKTENQRLHVIKYLYNENVNPDAPNNMNYTPLHIACNKQYKSIIEYLVEIGVDINYKDNFGNTPLHKLFTGNIKLEEKTSSGNIIPYPKKKNKIKTEAWKAQRTIIWDSIKNSPFIRAIDNTLRNSIIDNEELDRLRHFQEELYKINIDTSIINKVAKLKELQDASINEFKNIILRKWGNFAALPDIMVHTTTPTSLPPNDPTGLSIIRNADTKIYINTLINTQINNINTLLRTPLTTPIIDASIIQNMFRLFMRDIQQTLFNTRIDTNTNMYIHGIIVVGAPAIPDQIFDTITNLDTLVDSNGISIVDTYNNFNDTYKYNGTFDFADNVIDLSNMTFIGGARTIQIIDPINVNLFIQLYNGDRDHIIPKLVWTLIRPILQALTFNGNYNLRFSGKIVKLIVAIIYDNDINTSITEILQLLPPQPPLPPPAPLHPRLHHSNLIPLLNKDIIDSNKITWIYCFCNKYLENERNIVNLPILAPVNNYPITSSPLIYEMRMGIVLLTAGLINNKSNLLLSISQSIRSTLYREIICNTANNIYGFGDNNLPPQARVGSIVSAWLYLLFSTQVEQTIINNIYGNPIPPQARNFLNNNDAIHAHINHIIRTERQLGNIMLYAYDVMNTIIPTNIDELIRLQLYIDTGNPITNLCNIISKYYNTMEQPPQMLHVADIIALIRKKTLGNYQDLLNILYNYQIETRTFDRLQNSAPGVINTFAQVQDLIDPNLNQRLSLEKRNNNMFFNITEDGNGFSDNIYIINEYALPSRVNYYLFKYFNRNNNVDADTILYALKFIESYYLGLNFFGHLPFVENIAHINYTYQQPYIGSRQVEFYTPNNLFNFYNLNQQTQAIYADVILNHQAPGGPPPPGPLIPPPPLIELNLHNTLQYDGLYRPATIMSVASVMSIFEDNINRILNYLLERLRIMFTNFQQTKTSALYGTVITELYPMIYNLTEYSKKFVPLNNIINTEYSTVITELANRSTRNIIIPNITTELNTFNLFNLNTLERHINHINGYIFILYYTSANTANMKIPKFIYHSLGSKFKQLVVYNSNEELNLNRPITDPLALPPTNTTILDNIKSMYNKNIALFMDVINNVNFINKQSLTYSYITSKISKLPPSLSNVLNEFYRFNLIELIGNNNITIDPNIITIENLNQPMKDIQLLYLKAKMIEEILSLYFKNKVIQYTLEHYNTKVKPTPIPYTLDLEQVYNDINNNFIIELNKEPSQLFLDYITTHMADRNILRLFYSFVEKKNNNKKQFYIYPDNYFGTNLLNNKYVVNINNNIINFMLQRGANIMLHNNEKLSPLLMFMKNYYYEGLKSIKNYITINDYKDNTDSPFNYLFRVFKNHLNLYDDKFIDNQYNEVIQIIQSNDLYYNNVLQYVDTSFKTVKYLTEQFLTETMLKFSDEYKNTDLTDILRLLGFTIDDMTNMTDITYNMKLGNEIIIPDDDDRIVIRNLLKDLHEKITTHIDLYNKYNITRTELININKRTSDIDTDIATNNRLINILQDKAHTLIRIFNGIPNQRPIYPTNERPKIIDRYNDMLTNMNNNYLSYMDGWKQLHNLTGIIDKLPQYIVNYLNTFDNYKDHTTIRLLHKSYKNTYNIIKDYFENPKFISENKILGFVYDVLIHLTQTFICSNIESIIKKILYDFLINTESIPITITKINYMFDGIRTYLYEDIPKLLVVNSVGILDEREDEVSGQTASEILNQLIILLQTTSVIEINEYTLNILKNNIIPYFDTIIYKLINNWNVSIENIFIYHINQYRIMECIVQCI